MDIKKMTDTEIKGFLYEQFKILQQMQMNIQIGEQELALRNQPKEEVSND